MSNDAPDFDDERPYIQGAPPPAVHLGPGSHLTEPVDATEAHRIADQADRDPDAAVVLFPTIDSVLSDEQDPAQALNGIRTLLSSLHKALHKGLAQDMDGQPPANYGSHLGSTARVMEDALMQVYSAEPLVLARVLMQSQIDALLDEMQDVLADLEGDDDEETEGSGEPAAPVEPTSTRGSNDAETTDAEAVLSHILFVGNVETMPDGSTRYSMSDEDDAHTQDLLLAIAVDAAEEAVQDSGPGNGVDRLRALRGYFSLALAHVGEAIQTLEPDAEQVGTSTAANGISHEIRLGDSA